MGKTWIDWNIVEKRYNGDIKKYLNYLLNRGENIGNLADICYLNASGCIGNGLEVPKTHQKLAMDGLTYLLTEYPKFKERQFICENILQHAHIITNSPFDRLVIICNINSSKHSKTKRKSIPGSLRHEVFKRDRYRCVECGATNKDTRLHIDHILPVSCGGSNELDNLQTLCEECNLAKSDRAWKGGI